MAKYYNPGQVNLGYAREAILINGGNENLTRYRDGTFHHSLYLKTYDWHLSWDERPDGSIENIHSVLNGRCRWAYEAGFE